MIETYDEASFPEISWNIPEAGAHPRAKEAEAADAAGISIDLTGAESTAITVELDDHDDHEQIQPEVESDLELQPLKAKKRSKKKKATTSSAEEASSSTKGKKKKKEVDKDALRKLAEEAARRWQERDDKLEASIRVVEQRGRMQHAAREATASRATPAALPLAVKTTKKTAFTLVSLIKEPGVPKLLGAAPEQSSDSVSQEIHLI
eukprot:g17646.t1